MMMHAERFADLEERADVALAREHETPTLPGAALEAAKAAGQITVAGFDVVDEASERAALDDARDLRRREIEMFRRERAELRELLADRGITPLAILPTSVWRRLCLEAKLYRFAPSNGGMVSADPRAFAIFKDFSGMAVGWKARAARIDEFAKKNWPLMLEKLFPGYQEVGAESGMPVTLELPKPPPEVAAILIKAKRLPLQVVAEAAAIGIKEPMSLLDERSGRLMDAKKPFWARMGYASYEAYYAEHEPIVTTDHGNATAVLAQFGPYLFEQDLVDRVIAGDNILGDGPLVTEPLAYPATLSLRMGMYENALDEEMQKRYDRTLKQYERAFLPREFIVPPGDTA